MVIVFPVPNIAFYYQKIMVIKVYKYLIIIQHLTVITSPSKEFNISAYLLPCRETVLRVEYEGLGMDDVHNLTIEHLPALSIASNDTHISLEIENEAFRNCEDMMYELQCQITETDTYTSVVNCSKTTVNVEDYLSNTCRIR